MEVVSPGLPTASLATIDDNSASPIVIKMTIEDEYNRRGMQFGSRLLTPGNQLQNRKMISMKNRCFNFNQTDHIIILGYGNNSIS